MYDVAKWKMESGRVPKIQVFRAISREEVLDKFKVDVHTYNLLMTDLHRLGLIDGGQLTKMYKLAPVSTTFLHFELTRLGTNFVRSCLPPLVVAKLAPIDT